MPSGFIVQARIPLESGSHRSSIGRPVGLGTFAIWLVVTLKIASSLWDCSSTAKKRPSGETVIMPGFGKTTCLNSVKRGLDEGVADAC